MRFQPPSSKNVVPMPATPHFRTACMDARRRGWPASPPPPANNADVSKEFRFSRPYPRKEKPRGEAGRSRVIRGSNGHCITDSHCSVTPKLRSPTPSQASQLSESNETPKSVSFAQHRSKIELCCVKYRTDGASLLGQQSRYVGADPNGGRPGALLPVFWGRRCLLHLNAGFGPLTVRG